MAKEAPPKGSFRTCPVELAAKSWGLIETRWKDGNLERCPIATEIKADTNQKTPYYAHVCMFATVI